MRLIRPTLSAMAVSALALAVTLPAVVEARTNGGNGGGSHAMKDTPAEIAADQLIHDRDLNTVTASGHVEVTQAGRTLLADNLSYNLKQDVIIATGNVSMTEQDGQVTFADYVELTGDMKDAAAQRMRILMIDDSRMWAASGRRVGGSRTILDKGGYTACKACADKPNATPLWAMKAKQITHDETNHVIEYDDAWLEFEGVPVAYTPFFAHADTTIKRKSGLLPPSILNNGFVGMGFRQPYFQEIDEQQDITLTPMITSKQGEQLGAVHRLATANGEARTAFSVADMPTGGEGSKATVGSHIDSHGLFDLNDSWRAGWSVQRASDKDYLNNYGYRTSKPYLVTEPYLERFGYKTYTEFNGYSFQELSKTIRTNVDPLTRSDPVVLPMATYSYVGDPNRRGAYWSLDSRAAALTRPTGTSSERLNSVTAWHLPMTTNNGQIIEISSGIRMDGYQASHISTEDHGNTSVARAVPQATIDWRMPFARVGSISSQVLTPIVVASATPYGANSRHIPNEDGLSFELDDINIFSPMPYTGYDRIFAGPRVAYGLDYTLTSRGMPSTEVVVGQSYQARPDRAYLPGNGMDDTFSDIVSSIVLRPSSIIDFGYRTRMDKDNGVLRRSELISGFGPKPFHLETNYTFFDKVGLNSPYSAREQLSNTVSMQLSHYWNVQIYNVENLGEDAGPLNSGLRLTYDDECFQTVLDGGKNHETVRGSTSGSYVMLRFVFKTLGTVPVNLY